MRIAKQAQSNLDINTINYLSVIKQLQNDGFKHCIKTGRRLHKISFEELNDCIQIHGINRAVMLCAHLQKSIATEWILTDPIALQRLANKQAVEYFIYAVSNLIPTQLQTDTIDTIDKLTIGYQSLDTELQIKINANCFLSKLAKPYIIQISELIRLILANNRPAAMQEMFNTFSLNEITSSTTELDKFYFILKACYEQIKTGYYDENLISARNRQKKQAFLKQRTLIVRTELEQQIANSLDEIELDILINPDDKSNEFIKLKMQKDAKRLKKDAEKLRAQKRISIDTNKVKFSDIKPQPKFKGIRR